MDSMNSVTPEKTHVEILDAMQRVRLKVGKLPKDSRNPHFNNRFTSLEMLTERVMPVLDSEELAWVTLPGMLDGQPVLHYELIHKPTNQRLKGQMPLMLAKSDPQGQGSGLTYARRYTLVTVLNLIADEDDDGHVGAQAQTAEPGQTLAQLAYGKSPQELAAVFAQVGLNVPPDPLKTLSGPIPDEYFEPLKAALTG